MSHIFYKCSSEQQQHSFEVIFFIKLFTQRDKSLTLYSSSTKHRAAQKSTATFLLWTKTVPVFLFLFPLFGFGGRKQYCNFFVETTAKNSKNLVAMTLVRSSSSSSSQKCKDKSSAMYKLECKQKKREKTKGKRDCETLMEHRQSVWVTAKRIFLLLSFFFLTLSFHLYLLKGVCAFAFVFASGYVIFFRRSNARKSKKEQARAKG